MIGHPVATDMQEVLNIVGWYYNAFVLSINADKTEVLYQSIGPGPSERPDLRVGNVTLKVVK